MLFCRLWMTGNRMLQLPILQTRISCYILQIFGATSLTEKWLGCIKKAVGYSHCALWIAAPVQKGACLESFHGLDPISIDTPQSLHVTWNMGYQVKHDIRRVEREVWFQQCLCTFTPFSSWRLTELLETAEKYIRVQLTSYRFESKHLYSVPHSWGVFHFPRCCKHRCCEENHVWK